VTICPAEPPYLPLPVQIERRAGRALVADERDAIPGNHPRVAMIRRLG
jgi:hypothetical protein